MRGCVETPAELAKTRLQVGAGIGSASLLLRGLRSTCLRNAAVIGLFWVAYEASAARRAALLPTLAAFVGGGGCSVRARPPPSGTTWRLSTASTACAAGTPGWARGYCAPSSPMEVAWRCTASYSRSWPRAPNCKACGGRAPLGRELVRCKLLLHI